MPELPEVEVSRLGISPHLEGKRIEAILVRNPQLRWPVPEAIQHAVGHTINTIKRRAKYLFLNTDVGSIVLHLGMSGRLRVVDKALAPLKHDHIDIVVSSGQCLRLNDARRFGACLWQPLDAPPMPLLCNLGPEPLTEDFDDQRLYTLSRGKQVAVKNFIMANQTVVGVGNIYANEALFLSGIDPRRAAGKISRERYTVLTKHIRNVLAAAIKQGGTTLKDFTQADGKPGYFSQHLRVYGRAGAPCEKCGAAIKSVVIGQRNSFYCPDCQR
ncbi:bifunctional DNA-formamidopyrimidine glycosylase/DNA-(apurinic or apyrimidinic site) lyase [Alteromonas oceanisediminis]|uniref:bifunctional DNA-formamidopyrimidine glycosylase/DNA-(apurinic or apyrimidinic site) lyase n=1 Tax=Alteromonas oceanisediminis TaxID=2836180 RepID=UPI001BD912E5|nr:bifunctional DNA-formamidopyrimidine glycosylase/DNA-(apurinic or apyrimidinic site) lyase [Alteromonas oceanisediminis]MBT0586749.1 bifunctional DNA-formamidopyrimidine glycosylase/DNA-(apurinic or apyrimidinic site) lyase [Alteromonas oceanisediminis]